MGSPPPETHAAVAENAWWGLPIELACAKPRRLWRLFGAEGPFGAGQATCPPLLQGLTEGKRWTSGRI
jgi:hypothetical protein